MAHACPTCGREFPRVNGEAALDRLQTACVGLGIAVSWDGTVSENDAAALLNRAPNTLRNWRMGNGPLLFERSGTRIRYQLSELARFNAAGQKIDE